MTEIKQKTWLFPHLT